VNSRRVRHLAVMAAFLLCGVTVGLVYRVAGETEVGTTPPEARSGVASACRTDSERQTIEAYRRANPAVVFISTVTLTIDPFDFFAQVQPQHGSGSGTIVDAARGLIITNVHVIKDAQQLQITLVDGRPRSAKLLGYDENLDIAVLQLDNPPKDLVALPFGDSASLEVGQHVLAIGNPFGLNRTLTSGIISSLDRTIRSPGEVLMKGLIQTDAAINPGNSGGPLLDGDGRLIGLNTAILSQSGDSAGIGFAVPINIIKRVLPELIQRGRLRRPELGWVLLDTNQGPMVRRVMRNSPAARAGIQPVERVVESVFMKGYVRDFENADLVCQINGRLVQSAEEAEEIIADSGPDRPVQVVLRRGGRNGAQRSVAVQPELR
jgi:S1-C subfamily serine protease